MEFSRPVVAERLPAGEAVYEIAASAPEREALARRLDLVALDRLEARICLNRLGGGLIGMAATLSADVVQRCVVTLEPVANRVDDAFTLLFGGDGDEVEGGEVVVDGAAEIREPLCNGAIDLGEAVAQQLSLALDPFPRAADAPVAATDENRDVGPFAALVKWRKKR